MKSHFVEMSLQIPIYYFIYHIFTFIIWLRLTRTGNYQIHEFDWLNWILTAV